MKTMSENEKRKWNLKIAQEFDDSDMVLNTTDWLHFVNSKYKSYEQSDESEVELGNELLSPIGSSVSQGPPHFEYDNDRDILSDDGRFSSSSFSLITARCKSCKVDSRIETLGIRI